MTQFNPSSAKLTRAFLLWKVEINFGSVLPAQRREKNLQLLRTFVYEQEVVSNNVT